MKKLIYIWLIGIAFMLNGCIDDPFELPPPVEQESVFGGSISIDGQEIDMSVTQDGYELLTSYELDSEDYYLLKGALVPTNCISCGPSLEIMIIDENIGPEFIGEINADDISVNYPLGQFVSNGEITLTLNNYSDLDYYSWLYFTDSIFIEQEPEVTFQQIPGSIVFLEASNFNCSSFTSFLIDSEVRYLSIEAEQTDSLVLLTAIGQDQSEEFYWCINGEEMGPSDSISVPITQDVLDICLSNYPLFECEPIVGAEQMSTCYSFFQEPGLPFDFCIPDISAEYHDEVQSYARIVFTDEEGEVYDSDYFSPIDEFELFLTDLEDYIDPDGEEVIKFNTSINLPLYSQWGEMINLQVDSLGFAVGHP